MSLRNEKYWLRNAQDLKIRKRPDRTDKELLEIYKDVLGGNDPDSIEIRKEIEKELAKFLPEILERIFKLEKEMHGYDVTCSGVLGKVEKIINYLVSLKPGDFR